MERKELLTFCEPDFGPQMRYFSAAAVSSVTLAVLKCSTLPNRRRLEPRFKSCLCHFAIRQIFSDKDCIWSQGASPGRTAWLLSRSLPCVLLYKASAVWAVTHPCKWTLLGLRGVRATKHSVKVVPLQLSTTKAHCLPLCARVCVHTLKPLSSLKVSMKTVSIRVHHWRSANLICDCLQIGKHQQKGRSCVGWGSEEPEHYFCKGKKQHSLCHFTCL